MDKYEKNLCQQIRMNSMTWERLVNHGVTSKTKLHLDFIFYAPTESKAQKLKAILEKYEYEVAIRRQERTRVRRAWVVEGKTFETTVNLKMLDQWVAWMIEAGKRGNSDFDGWGTQVA